MRHPDTPEGGLAPSTAPLQPEGLVHLCFPLKGRRKGGGNSENILEMGGDGDFSPQNILEGIGWEVGTSYSRQEAWWTGLSECLAHRDHLAAWHRPRPGQPAWRPMEPAPTRA